MAKKCKKQKYFKEKMAILAAKALTRKYGSAMMAYKCPKCIGSVWHIANKPDTLHMWQWQMRKKEKRIT